MLNLAAAQQHSILVYGGSADVCVALSCPAVEQTFNQSCLGACNPVQGDRYLPPHALPSHAFASGACAALLSRARYDSPIAQLCAKCMVAVCPGFTFFLSCRSVSSDRHVPPSSPALGATVPSGRHVAAAGAWLPPRSEPAEAPRPSHDPVAAQGDASEGPPGRGEGAADDRIGLLDGGLSPQSCSALDSCDDTIDCEQGRRPRLLAVCVHTLLLPASMETRLAEARQEGRPSDPWLIATRLCPNKLLCVRGPASRVADALRGTDAMYYADGHAASPAVNSMPRAGAGGNIEGLGA